jgi:arsenical pump membrane protein
LGLVQQLLGSGRTSDRAGFRQRLRQIDLLDAVAVALALLGLLAVLTGALPASDASATLRRILPLLGFLVTVIVLAELVGAAEVFDVVAARLARLGAGRPVALFGLCVLLATVTTVALNLDTTAVLLTPVLLALAVRVGLPPLATAMTTIWLANTASLLLPISNLTNVLAADQVGLSPLGFAARMIAPAGTAIVVTAVLLWWFFWRPAIRQLDEGRYRVPPVHEPADGRLALVALLAAVLFLAGVLAGLPLELASTAGAAVVVLAFAVRRRSALHLGLLPWRLVVLVIGVFLVIQTISEHGLDALVGDLIGGAPDGSLGTARVAATGALLANLVNNLPAYVAGEAALTGLSAPGGDQQALLALLIGVNVGPLITPWASLATVIWFERCRAAGVSISLPRFMLTGTVLVIAAVSAATAALVLTG